MSESAVVIKDLYKSFKLPHEKQHTLKQAFLGIFRRRRGYEKQEVLKDITFEVQKGEFFGIVGRNGSGKSTLLKLIAEIYTPDKGDMRINGTLTPFIELGVGFNPELTGRENIFLNGALLGFSRKEMVGMYDDIVSFAELEAFMDQKLKNYSSGMQVRLAFSIAIRARSDILLLDEVLAVGDAIFQKKCFNYFRELKREKRTVIFISHDPNALLEYCDSGVLIDKGRIISRGHIRTVVNDYIDLLNGVEEKQSEENIEQHENKKRWGTGGVFVDGVRVMDVANKKKSVFTEADEQVVVEVTFRAESAVDKPIYGITVANASGERLFTSNTLWSKVSTGSIQPGESVVVRWELPNAFNTGDLSISPAVASNDGSTTYDWLDDAAFFKVRKRLQSFGSINLPHSITMQKKG